jgi:2-dehydro-3-deoxygalactonokinase
VGSAPPQLKHPVAQTVAMVRLPLETCAATGRTAAVKSIDGRFVSCDWGTTNLRVRLVAPGGKVLGEHKSAAGILAIAAANTAGDARNRALDLALGQAIAEVGAGSDRSVPVVISGMASSTLGWQALPYASLPAPVDGSTFVFNEITVDGRSVLIVSGVRAESDVMRGEETEIVGLFATPRYRELAEDCVLIMPGTHSKHVTVRERTIVNFATHMTGELYALLNQHSTIRCAESGFDAESFRAGVKASRGQPLNSALFQTRARTVLGQLPAAGGASFLSGVLIGSEVAHFNPLERSRVALAAGGELATRYRVAFAELHPTLVITEIDPAAVAQAPVIAHELFLRSSR